MLTKEEYKESLNELFVYSKHIANKVEVQSLSECYERLEQLIIEHFELLEKYQNLQDENARLSFDKIVNNIEDMNYKLWLENPPLKFEELKRYMWVWVDCCKMYEQIQELADFGETKLVIFNCGSLIFDDGCLYRKQVEE